MTSPRGRKGSYSLYGEAQILFRKNGDASGVVLHDSSPELMIPGTKESQHVLKP